MSCLENAKKFNPSLCCTALALTFFLLGPGFARADAISDGIDKEIRERQNQFARWSPVPAPASVSSEVVRAETAPPVAPAALPEPAAYSAPPVAPSRIEDESVHVSIRALQEQVARLEAAQTQNAATRGSYPVAAAPIQTPVSPMPSQASLANAAPAVPPAKGASAEVSTPQTGPYHGAIALKPGVTANLGGFFDTTTIYRSKNESADAVSSYNISVPFNNSVNAHQAEFRETMRSTRLIGQVGGNVDKNISLTGYAEMDFLGAGTTSNSGETNSYYPRVRQMYLTYDDRDWGLHFLGGQAWSFATLDNTGLVPLTEAIPAAIDIAGIVGFNYTRNTGLRLTKDFDDKKLWVGVAAESPQTITTGLACTANASSGTCSGFNSTYTISNTGNTVTFSNPLSTDQAPDLIAKMAYDPGWGHYEILGMTRFFHDNIGASAHNNNVVGWGGGAGALLPVIEKKLDLRGQFLVGQGIGRYGPAQFPDVVVMPNGALKPVSQITAMAGITGHPTPSWDTYVYAGGEKVQRVNSSSLAYGYGDYGLTNSGCNTIGGSCSAQTSEVWQISPGFWHRFYKGDYGRLQAGVQYSFVRRDAFSDSHGVNPHALENIGLLSFRYFPY